MQRFPGIVVEIGHLLGWTTGCLLQVAINGPAGTRAVEDGQTVSVEERMMVVEVVLLWMRPYLGALSLFLPSLKFCAMLVFFFFFFSGERFAHIGGRRRSREGAPIIFKLLMP